jgi:hypothetical protein
MQKMPRITGSVLSAVYSKQRDKQESLYFRFLLLSAVLELPILGGDVKGRESIATSVTYIFTVVLLDCSLKLPVLSH